MAQSNGDVLAKDFGNIILAWSSGISGEQREVLAPGAEELVQMLCSSAERVRKQHELDAKINEWYSIGDWNAGMGIVELFDLTDKRIAELKAERAKLGGKS